jgi:hypothetical protein
MENQEKPAKDAIREARFLLKHPDFLREYQQSRKIYHNTAPIYGNHEKIYDEIGPAIEYLSKAKPDLYRKFVEGLHKLVEAVNHMDYDRALVIWNRIDAVVSLANLAPFPPDSQELYFFRVLKAYCILMGLWLNSRAAKK